MRSGYIYILTNISLPADCVKIGLTRKTPEHRALALSRMAAIPTPFVVFSKIKVNDVFQAERRMHLVLDEMRINSSKEFFKISPEDAESLLSEIAAFEEERYRLSGKIHVSNSLICARYLPFSSIRNRKVLYGMIAATVNNSPFERITGNRRTIVDGFLSIGQVGEYLDIERRSAAKALSEFVKSSQNLECYPIEAAATIPVFEMVRYRNGHATWRFSASFREHFYI